MELLPTGNGGARLVLDDDETDVIRRLTGEMRALLVAQDNESDPVLDRLFPNAYEDRRDEAAYRELIGEDLLREKLEALDAVSTTLGKKDSDITLEGESLRSWLAVLTDMRLAIGTRLEVDEEHMAADIDPRDPNAHAYAVLHWLGWIQEGLIQTSEGL